MSAGVMALPPEIVETAISRLLTICLPIEPGVVSVELATFHTAAGTAVIADVIEEN